MSHTFESLSKTIKLPKTPQGIFVNPDARVHVFLHNHHKAVLVEAKQKLSGGLAYLLLVPDGTRSTLTQRKNLSMLPTEAAPDLAIDGFVLNPKSPLTFPKGAGMSRISPTQPVIGHKAKPKPYGKGTRYRPPVIAPFRHKGALWARMTYENAHVFVAIHTPEACHEPCASLPAQPYVLEQTEVISLDRGLLASLGDTVSPGDIIPMMHDLHIIQEGTSTSVSTTNGHILLGFHWHTPQTPTARLWSIQGSLIDDFLAETKALKHQPIELHLGDSSGVTLRCGNVTREFTSNEVNHRYHKMWALILEITSSKRGFTGSYCTTISGELADNTAQFAHAVTNLGGYTYSHACGSHFNSATSWVWQTPVSLAFALVMPINLAIHKA